jgi:polysaccharide chain length determinant protein (PEP-CTERM system associated)
MIPKDSINLGYLKEAAKRRFWYIVLPFFFISLATTLYCIMIPEVYKGETIILVEPQKVPSDYVSSTVSTDVADRLRTIEEQVKSRTKLEKIIIEHNLYPNIRAERTMTDAIEVFRDNIEIHVRGGADSRALQISYLNSDPVKARDITNAIAGMFMSDNLKLRETQAVGTTRFLDRELKRMEEVLVEKEMSLREFKERYMNLLPEHMEQSYRMMEHLQQALDSVDATIQQTKDRKVLLKTSLDNLERMEAQLADVRDGSPGMWETGSHENFTSPAIAELQTRLEQLKIRYSDKHPDVIKLKAAISKLTKEQEAGASDAGSQAASAGDSSSSDVGLLEDQKETLLSEMVGVEGEITRLQAERNNIKKEINKYAERIESGPQIEAKLTDLTRGYDVAQANYQSLLDKKMKAELAENLERAQQGEQFRILDSARLPETPVNTHKKIWALGLMLALSVGFGLGGLLEYVDVNFWHTKELEDVVGVPVLVAIPVINTPSDLRKRQFKRMVATGALVSMACILLYVFFAFWSMDFAPIPPPVG